jgi:hypothetical protein
MAKMNAVYLTVEQASLDRARDICCRLRAFGNDGAVIRCALRLGLAQVEKCTTAAEVLEALAVAEGPMAIEPPHE